MIDLFVCFFLVVNVLTRLFIVTLVCCFCDDKGEHNQGSGLVGFCGCAHLRLGAGED